MMRVLKPRLMGVAAISMGSLEAWYVSYWLIDLSSPATETKMEHDAKLKMQQGFCERNTYL